MYTHAHTHTHTLVQVSPNPKLPIRDRQGWDWWKYQLFESNWWDPVIIDNFVQDVFCGEGQAYDHRQMEYVCDHVSCSVSGVRF
jgi:hypothetical protein